MAQREELLHHLRVLVHADLLALAIHHWDVLLPDGLDEADLLEALLQAAHERERHGRLPDMLARGRDENRLGHAQSAWERSLQPTRRLKV